MAQTTQQKDFDFIVRNDHRHDFNELARFYPPLKKYLLLIGFKTTIDFSKPQALICLTSAMIKFLCKVDWSLPKGHLCPRVPNRMNYLIWVNTVYKHQFPTKEIKSVIDIGTGAGLIYPILGSQLFGWSFVATELDQQSLAHSKLLLSNNNPSPIAQNTIKLLKSTGELLIGLIDPNQTYSMTICNPPFFENQQNSLSQMSSKEHHTEDGEYGFFFRLYGESLALPNIEMFTCLIGRRTSFYEIKKFLESERHTKLVSKCYFGMLVQGNCKRFAAAWTINKQNYSRLKFSKP